MKNIIKILLLSFLLSLSTGCGFQVVKQKNFGGFSIKEVNMYGNKRINFKIRNNLLINSSKNSKNLLIVNIESKKVKSIKEKNIKNQITKYKILIKSKIKFKVLPGVKNYEINVAPSADYQVGENYSNTLSSEKKAIDNLVTKISKIILDEISLKLDDL